MNAYIGAASVPMGVDLKAACWLFQGGRSEGYGVIYRDGKHIKAHRYMWLVMRGPIPEGLEIDHLCRQPLCVNPLHMEPVTHRENVLRGNAPSAAHARKTRCPQGHAYDSENTRIWSNDKRQYRACRECERIRSRRRRAARRTS